MRAYMAYSRGYGPAAGAALVYAETVRQARALVWPYVYDWLDGEFTDLAVTWIQDPSKVYQLADAKILDAGQPQVIDHPICCDGCGMWGLGVMDDGTCPDCEMYVGLRLAKRFGIEPREDQAAIAA